MGKKVLQLEQVSKQFPLGTLGAKTIKQDILSWFGQWKGNKNSTEMLPQGYFWALQDVSFEVEQGDVMGIIGRNGSGKSTLMKIISKILLPTSGVIRGNGKISSLLEIGTGFNGELSGKENIFLNGQILGMKKREIQAKFDEIVAFSGVEPFIDMPVKRYSSGMYVRLAFAVAAHLDAETLIVDEVLSVGDFDFQKKCMAKMRELTQQTGKTILLISHDMQSLRSLCNKAVYLDKGTVADVGTANKVITNYLWAEKIEYLQQKYYEKDNAPGNESLRIKKIELIPANIENEVIYNDTALYFEIDYWCLKPSITILVKIFVFSYSGECILEISSPAHQCDNRLYQLSCYFPESILSAGSYYFSIYFFDESFVKIWDMDACLSINLAQRQKYVFNDIPQGYIRPQFEITIKS